MKIKIVNIVIPQPLQNIRCQKCGALLGKYADLKTSLLEIKCRKCKTFNKFNA